MFTEEISLWAGGPTATLGDYFIFFRYLYCLLTLGFAIALYCRPRASLLFGGTLVLAVSGWLAIDLPLGRIYGLTEGGAALVELGPPMVVAATGAPAAGPLAAEANAWPFWSLCLALFSGFDPGRLLVLYPLVPLGALLLLAVGSFRAGRALETKDDERTKLVAALAVFFVLFLSAPRLSFLEAGGPLWVQVLWLRPRLGVGIAASLLGLAAFSSGRTFRKFAFGGAWLGVTAWLEPRLLVPSAIAVVLWMFLQARRREPVWSASLGLGVAAVLYALWAPHLLPSLGVTSWAWPAAVEGLLEVSLHQGGVFYLGVLGVVTLYRERRPSHLFLFCWVVSAYGLWAIVLLSPHAARLVDPVVLKSWMRVALALAAGFGAHRALGWLDARWPAELRPIRFLPPRSAYALGLAALVALSLPWTFPFWWNPVRMDPTYRESFVPISRQRLAFGEWLRESAPPDAVFAAGPSYAPWIPALSGRRVLVDAATWPVGSNESRDRALSALLGSRDSEAIREVVDTWGVTHVAWGRLDALPPNDAEFLESSPLFSLVHRQQRWVTVYEVSP